VRIRERRQEPGILLYSRSFRITTELTSLTGFLFPFKGVTPGIILGVLSLIALIAATVAEYFNVFVLVA
jgi:hypothetical protein